MEYRPYEPRDAVACAQIFFRAVREGAAGAYNAAERQAWAAQVPDTDRWHARLAAQTCFVAQNGEDVVGFMSLRPDGYLDLAFVLPEQMGKGTAHGLYALIVNAALVQGIERLHTQASHLARPFFARQGWQVDHEQEVKCNGVTLGNTVMSLLPARIKPQFDVI